MPQTIAMKGKIGVSHNAVPFLILEYFYGK